MSESKRLGRQPAYRGHRAPVEKSDRNFVVALARGLEVMRAFRPTDGFLGNQEISSRTGLPKPTVSRLTYTLASLGYLKKLERLGKYQLTPAALSLGYTAMAHLGIRHVARPYMQELANQTGASVALGCRDRMSVIYVGHCYSNAAVTVRLELGSRIPMATTAAGRALLAVMTPQDRENFLVEFKEREGARWPKLAAAIEKAVEDVATRGFALSLGEWQDDINGVGVPIIPADGSGVFALNCGAPAFKLDRQRLMRDVGPRLVSVAREIETVLGGHGSRPDKTGRMQEETQRGENIVIANERWRGGRRAAGRGSIARPL